MVLFAGILTAPLAEQVAGYSVQALTVLLFVVGIGLVVGNHLGGIIADRNLRQAQRLWPVLMVASLIVVGLVSSHIPGPRCLQ